MSIKGNLKINILFFLGLILLSLSVGSGLSTYFFIGKAQRAPGIVISEAFSCTHPEIQFTTLTGELIKYSQGGVVCFHENETIQVLYNLTNPKETACANTFGALYFLTLIFALLGLIFVLLRVFVMPGTSLKLH